MYKSKVGYPRYYRKKLIEYNKVDEDFFKNRYYKDLDNMQMSIISELKEAHINLQPDKHYFKEDLREKGGSNPAFSYCSTDTPLTNSFKTYLDT